MSLKLARACLVGTAVLAGLGAKSSDSLADLAAPPAAAKPAAKARAAAPAAPPLTAPTGPAYTIKLTRPAQVGDRYAYVADAMVLQSMTATVSGRQVTLRPMNLSVRFEAVEQVLALSETGEPSKAMYTITKCVRREGKSERPLLPPGRVLTVTASKWRSRIDVDEGGLSIQDEMILRGVVSLLTLKGISEDDCFGTDKPQKVGDAWAVNSDALARLISREGARVKKQHVSGTVKLAGVKNVDGVPHLLVSGKAIIQQWKPDAADMPEGTQFVRGNEEVKFTKLVPVDPSGHCLTDSFSEKAMLKVKTSDERIGPDVLVDAKLLKTVGIKRTPIQGEPVASGNE